MKEIMDEIMTWNVDNTDILNVLRKEVNEERLLKMVPGIGKQGSGKDLPPIPEKWRTAFSFPCISTSINSLKV